MNTIPIHGGYRKGAGQPKPKHTPAPWVVSGPYGVNHDTNYIIKHRSAHADGGAHATVNVLHITPEARATAKANADLIAASPDLLHALKFLLADYLAVNGPERTGSNVPLDKAREAIAKAQGETY